MTWISLICQARLSARHNTVKDAHLFHFMMLTHTSTDVYLGLGLQALLKFVETIVRTEGRNVVAMHDQRYFPLWVPEAAWAGTA